MSGHIKVNNIINSYNIFVTPTTHINKFYFLFKFATSFAYQIDIIVVFLINFLQ